jgi:hypothetical protein
MRTYTVACIFYAISPCNAVPGTNVTFQNTEDLMQFFLNLLKIPGETNVSQQFETETFYIDYYKFTLHIKTK